MQCRTVLNYKYAVVCLLVVVSACAKKRPTAPLQSAQSVFVEPSVQELRGADQHNAAKKILPASVRCLQGQQEQEARFGDIAIPFRAKRSGYQLQHMPYSVAFYYEVAQDIASLAQWLYDHMERYGWHQQIVFVGDQAVLTFNKPVKHCSITLERVGSNKTAMMIVVGSE